MKALMMALCLSSLEAASTIEKPGTRIVFAVTADGTPPIAFQWYKDGKPIPGATSATYVIPAFSREHSGIYIATATNKQGSAQSAPEAIYIFADAPKSIKDQYQKKP